MKEFRILRGISTRVLDRLRVKDIFWIFLDLFDPLDLFSLSMYDSLSIPTPATCIASLAPFSHYVFANYPTR